MVAYWRLIKVNSLAKKGNLGSFVTLFACERQLTALLHFNSYLESRSPGAIYLTVALITEFLPTA